MLVIAAEVVGVVADEVAADEFVGVAVAVVAGAEVVVVEGQDCSKIRRFGQRCNQTSALVAGHSSVLGEVSPLLVGVLNLAYFAFFLMDTVERWQPENGKARRHP